MGEARPTIVLEHSLGGVEGYFLIERLALLARVCIYAIFIRLQGVNQLRDKMHKELGNLSTNYLQFDASKSSHFVWVYQPDVIVNTVKAIVAKTRKI